MIQDVKERFKSDTGKLKNEISKIILEMQSKPGVFKSKQTELTMPYKKEKVKRKCLKVKKEIKNIKRIQEKVTNIKDRQETTNIHIVGAPEKENQI